MEHAFVGEREEDLRGDIKCRLYIRWIQRGESFISPTSGGSREETDHPHCKIVAPS